MPRGGSHPGERRGGRKRGTRNKRSCVLLEALDQAGCWLPEQIAILLKDPLLSVIVKVDLIKILLPYCYPQLKPVDPEGYLTPEQAAEMPGKQAVHFREAMEQHMQDPLMIALILDTVRASYAQSPCDVVLR
jgi:hypothetical protein